ncbi:MAG: acyloxyacyl hydrolase [Bacteroidia bacterium]|nr:acyloxyacyl hydrolase [Bacteroidia bacterium]NNF30481.1 deacylase [Flavobacteriaceae bacterium]NNM09729.1 deacylase [Flavobacteriaceae bacterium]
MKQLLTALFLFLCAHVASQEVDVENKSNFVLTPEFLLGYTAESNENFPDRSLQSQFILNFGWDHSVNPKEWAQRLKGPKTGISIGYTEFGNKDSLGGAITVMPFIEFGVFKSKRFKTQVGMGGSYFTKIYDEIENPLNQAMSTDLSWSFRAYLHYELLRTRYIDWRIGLGYSHHSNGHTRLPNQGYNSFLASVSADIKSRKSMEKDPNPLPGNFTRRINDYISLYGGYGINVLSLAYNDKRGVYTLSGEYGKVLNGMFKVGVGFYYRFYQHYYDYINDEEFLVREGEEFEDLTENPWWNGSNLGLHVNGEFMLNHVGFNVQLGVNLHKPAYDIDWRINQGWDNTPREIPPNFMLGEFDSKFRVKKILSSRMGLKYYVFDTSKEPINNLFLGIHINANGGQADFTDISIGYVYNFNYRER